MTKRLPPVEEHELDAAQQEVWERIAGGARGGVRGPFRVLLHSPELAGRVEQLGVYARYHCAVPQRQRELAIIVTAAFWRASYEWSVHAPLAERAGVPRAVVAQIGAGERPTFDDPLDRAVHDYALEVLRDRDVADATYDTAAALLGERGVLDLAGLVGYYTLLAIVMNAMRTPPEEGVPAPWREGRD